ncbi:ABC transporter ATP-binding protein [Cellulomonas aerilata]|uniref:ABC transporter ATP-binding protein n=1 Tax=Cellulomonas aerilata TaxID=515326 RepID=A0A512DA02_9CELL|nr:ABC transporter ATP-binding protein [Cellulomonas aerilata]GEO33312.1 ABC transporter ATP-binding protein [Cellulomonas aerilata]
MIEVRGLTKRYGNALAVDDLSFAVEPGKVTGFLGPNGAGKSTTMRLVLGLDRPTSGEALVDGQPFASLRDPLRRVGALLDAGLVHPGRSGRAHLQVAARTAGLPRRRVDEVIDLAGLGGAAGRRVKGYSLGMRQRLGIAAALLGNPSVLIFDEPINGLDLDGVRWLRGLLRQLADEGRTVLLSSHLLAEMQQTADRLVVIGRGRLIADATTDEVLQGMGGPRARLRTPEPDRMLAELTRRGLTARAHGDEIEVEGASAEQVSVVAHEVGVPLHHLSDGTHDLEQAYLELTERHVDHRSGPQPSAPTTPKEER